MKVKSFWLDGLPAYPVGTPLMLADGKRATIIRVEFGRVLVEAVPPIPFQLLENAGIGFSQFEDTED